MNFFFKISIFFTVSILFASLIFLKWASSPNLNTKEYSKLLTYNYPLKINKDSIYTIVTYNIGYLSGMTNNKSIAKPIELFKKNQKKVISEFKKINPDIIAFQEIDYKSSRSFNINQETEIAELGYNYVARGVNWDKRFVPFPYWPPSMFFGKIISGQSVLSKYKIKKYKRYILERVSSSPFYRDALYLDRLAQVVKIKIKGQEIIVINVHLEAFDKKTRKKQFRFVIDKLFNKFKNNYPTILLGDFNSKARDNKSVIKELLLKKDIGNAAFNSKKILNTFDTKDLFERIDYIFYTKKTIELIESKILNDFEQSSDHLPIMMRFKIKE